MAIYFGRILAAFASTLATIAISVVLTYILFLRGGGANPSPLPGPPAPPAPSPAPLTKFQAIGSKYSRALVSTYADAASAMAGRIEAGDSVAEAQQGLQAAWKANRSRKFVEIAEPGFTAIVPPNTDPSPAKRSEFAAAWREFASGMGK